MSSPPTPPPGFYRDPDGLPVERWWDGEDWTDKKRPLQPETVRVPASYVTLRDPWDWRRIANYRSRCRRSEFWAAFFLGNVAFAVAANPDLVSNPNLEWLSFAAGFAGIWLLSGSSVNRLHDTGRSGWMILWVFVPIANLIILIMMGAQRGEPQTNEWGPPVA